MQDTHIYRGIWGEYQWVASRATVFDLRHKVIEHHAGAFLYVVACDGTPLTPSSTDLAMGWEVQRRIAVSPPMTPDVEVPAEEYDEWYVFDRLVDMGSEVETFVNYGGFTLKSPDEDGLVTAEQGLELLAPIQGRFRHQIRRLSPRSYISTGDFTVVATRDKAFITTIVA